MPRPDRPIPRLPTRRRFMLGFMMGAMIALLGATPVQRGETVMQWDYLLVEETMAAADLARVGAEGWELVAVVSPAHFVFHYFFKRPRRG